MKTHALATVLALAASSATYAALPAGAEAPLFEAQAALAGKAQSFVLKEAIARGPVVVYFYPAAYTNGCNLQARTFADKQTQFAAAGATVIGVSLDNIRRLTEFSADPEFCAGKVAVASDADGRIARAYDLQVREVAAGRKDVRGVEIGHDAVERTTFVIDRSGRIAATISGVAPATNVEQALAAVQSLAAVR
ncbi:bacterioferritin comigratory protein [Azoarcus olearius]|uniref:peroxiredoxin n=1 Tax=Azoarcus sp. (strain BH72) TaxID=418699 RepID=UPI00080623DA|nr:redoxin domain-containing protein [Azoarcus olearius]ANQ85503.1 bacterioferritin comigratory protein [Azoarcus olearius]